MPADTFVAAKDSITRWRRSPAAMVRELFGIEPDAWQLEVLELFPTSPRLAMVACAGPGKTATLAWLIWNFMLTRPHAVVGVTSITSDNLKANLWRELAIWRDKSPIFKAAFEMNSTAIYARDHPTTWRAEARTWARDANAEQIGNALRGLHSPYIMWAMDESGDYPNSILPVIENIFAGAPKEAHIVQAGNPTKRDGPLYRAAAIARDLWKVVNITGDPDDPKRSPRISIEHAREQIKQYGRDNGWVMVNILGQFPPSSFNSLIGHEEVREAMVRYYREDELRNSPKVLGQDVARFGDDQSCTAPRQGLQMFPLIKHRNLDSIQGAALVNRKWAEWDAQACFVDNTGGFGAGWIDQLRVLGRTPIPVEFSGQAHDPNRYFNKRTEMAFDLVEWIKRGGALPEDQNLLNALVNTTYTFKGDRLLLEPKDMVKKKMSGASPDEMDAAMMTLAEQVTMISTGSRRVNHRAVNKEYNPFEGIEQAVNDYGRR